MVGVISFPFLIFEPVTLKRYWIEKRPSYLLPDLAVL